MGPGERISEEESSRGHKLRLATAGYGFQFRGLGFWVEGLYEL